ncbi:hypothetical protein [uncultured Sphingomonas sp.]|uniref:hypothetical protein n=1 Tax=uncultured Sphingomonas sp. TaxID=158754 RepID=UPI0025E70CD1|nr:hypothetical protein [uncultured Sphingomonas sp.]
MLNIAGTLCATGDAMTLGDGTQAVSLANGGTLTGSVAGGAGDDIATVGVAGARTLAASLTGFKTLASTGTGTLTLTGAQSYGQVLAGTDLTIASGGSLTNDAVRMGGGNERLQDSVYRIWTNASRTYHFVSLPCPRRAAPVPESSCRSHHPAGRRPGRPIRSMRQARGRRPTGVDS